MSTSQSDRTLGLDRDPVDREALSLPGAEEQIELLLVSGKVAASQHAQETATHDHCARRPRRTVSREASWRQMYQTRLLQRASADTDSDAGEPHYTKPWRVPLPSRPPRHVLRTSFQCLSIALVKTLAGDRDRMHLSRGWSLPPILLFASTQTLPKKAERFKSSTTQTLRRSDAGSEDLNLLHTPPTQSNGSPSVQA